MLKIRWAIVTPWFTALLLLVLADSGAHASPRPANSMLEGHPKPDSEYAKTFGYPTVAAALLALRARRDVSISEQKGWTIVDDKPNYTIWSFTPQGHPAHPTGVKRVIVQDGSGALRIIMTERCEAEATACERLLKDFRVLNERVREEIRSPQPSKY